MLKYSVEGKGKGKERGTFVLAMKVTDQRTKDALMRNREINEPKISFNFEAKELEIDGSVFQFTCQEETRLECYSVKDKTMDYRFVGDVTSKLLMKTAGRNFEETISKTRTENESASHATELLGARPKKRRNSTEQDPSKRQKLAVDKTLRTKTIQLLAIAPLELGDMITTLETTKELLKPVLAEIAFPTKDGKHTLKQSCWKDIQIYTWDLYTDSQRQMVAENAKKAFEKAGLPQTAPQWKLLRAPKTATPVNPRLLAVSSPSTPATPGTTSPITPSTPAVPSTPATPIVASTPVTPAAPTPVAPTPVAPTPKIRVSLGVNKEKQQPKAEVSTPPFSEQTPTEKEGTTEVNKAVAPKIKLTFAKKDPVTTPDQKDLKGKDQKDQKDQKSVCAIQTAQQFQDYEQRFHTLYPTYQKLLEEDKSFKNKVSMLSGQLNKVKGTPEESGARKKIAEVHQEWEKSGVKKKLQSTFEDLNAIKMRMKEFAEAHKK